jgi:hypothetical protein
VPSHGPCSGQKAQPLRAVCQYFEGINIDFSTVSTTEQKGTTETLWLSCLLVRHEADIFIHYTDVAMDRNDMDMSSFPNHMKF